MGNAELLRLQGVGGVVGRVAFTGLMVTMGRGGRPVGAAVVSFKVFVEEKFRRGRVSFWAIERFN